MLVNVVDDVIVQQVFHAPSTSDELSGERRRHIVGDPVRDDGDVPPVLAEQVGVEDELLGVAAAAGDDDQAVLAENRFQLLIR